MRRVLIVVGIVFLLFPGIASASATEGRDAAFHRALTLYDNGVYERARVEFENLGDDPLCKAYVVLCAMKLRTNDAPALLSSFENTVKKAAVSPLIHFEYARILFDGKAYARALAQLDKLKLEDLERYDRPEYLFKKAFCYYELGEVQTSKQFFSDVLTYPKSDYSAPSTYILAFIAYSSKDFKTADKYFEMSVKDSRFADLSRFYIVDCRFNLKNYDYVLKEGVRLFDAVPKERQERLARIISESYLVKGDKASARKYYDKASKLNMTRADYFYAGTVLYGVEDYRGAIEAYLKVENRTDSIGQIANYHLANSYLHTRQQVLAMDAFKEAASVDFDSEMTEDATFNYAKLSFDLNKDTGGFAWYLRKYSTSKRGESTYGYIALAALYDRDYERAVWAYDHIETLSPDMLSNYTKANYLRASQLVSNGAWKDALPCLRATAYYLPKYNRFGQLSRYWIGECEYHNGNYREASEIFLELLNSSSLQGMTEGSALNYNLASCSMNTAAYADAAKWYDSYIASGFKECREDALLRRADCDFLRGLYKEATVSYGKYLDEYSNPDNIYPYYRRALSYGLSGDKKTKVETLVEVEKATPSSKLYDDAMFELGKARMDIKDNTGAERTFSMLKMNATGDYGRIKALMGLGMVKRNTGKYDESLAAYKEVVALNPAGEDGQSALQAIESIYRQRRQMDKYISYVEENRLAESRSADEKEEMYFNAAEQLCLSGDWNAAIDRLEKFKQTYPTSERIHQADFYLAESFRGLGDKQKACEKYAAVMDSLATPSFAETALYQYASLSYSLGHFSDAFDAFKKLLTRAQLDANRHVARLGMMRAAYRARQYEDAVMAARGVKSDTGFDSNVIREADYVTAKSLLLSSRRKDAMDAFRKLYSSHPSTPEGAEAGYFLIQDLYDNAHFDKVETAAYDFSTKSSAQSYWLARVFIVLGDSFAERGNAAQAKATFESIRDGYTAQSADDDIQNIVKMRLERLEAKQ